MLKKRMLDIKPDFELCQVCSLCGNLYPLCVCPDRAFGPQSDRTAEFVNLACLPYPGKPRPGEAVVNLQFGSLSAGRLRAFARQIQIELSRPNDPEWFGLHPP